LTDCWQPPDSARRAYIDFFGDSSGHRICATMRTQARSVEHMQSIQDTSSPTEAEPTTTPVNLAVHVGSRTYIFGPDDAPVVIGRESPAQIIISDEHVSRTHVRVDHTLGSGWVAEDRSRNGIFVDGHQPSKVRIGQGLTINLGSPGGIAATFEPEPDTQSDVADDDDDDVADPGIAFAGAAVAARRDELNVTQRSLARARIVNAGGLIAFEKGRRWPRTTTRSKLEQVLQWPEGHISDLRRQGTNDSTEHTDANGRTGGNSSAVRTSLLTGAAQVALTTIKSAITTLPDLSDPTFSDRAGILLADLRRLETVAASAAQSTEGAPDITLTLGAVRRCYRELMLRVARAPGATLGQQLYAARQRYELNREETANAAGVPVSAVEAAEAEIALDDKTTAAITAAITALNRRR
jgi:transcriptional regulator with XRE-family HTH domain